MIRRKLTSLILCAALSAGLLVGCNSSSGSASGSENGVVEISVWAPQPNEAESAYYTKRIEEFNEEYEGKYKATIELIPRANGYEYENKINSAATSGDLPDVISMDGPTVANYADSGIVVPIDQYISDEEKSDFVDSVITQGTYNGELYALGTAESSVLLFYNKKMLDEAGITPPTSLEEAWTWEDVYEAAKKLTKDGVYGINMEWDLGEGQIYGFAPIIWSAGTEIISEDGKTADGYLNSPEAVEALTYYQKFATEGLMNLQALPNEFEEGKAAMYLVGSWEFATLESNYPDLEYGATYYPASVKTNKVVSPSGDWCWGVTSGSENEEAAAELVKFLTNEDSVKEFSKASGKPGARKSVIESTEEYNELPKSILKDQVLNTAHPRPLTTSYPVLSKEFSSAMQDIRTGADVKTALDKVVQRFEEDVKRNN
ncbi:MAG: sugar ABC transporter substrate-binding protein [Peptostreptococcaceae bacterium]|nr:sugar ABC transporter substrate-binding protein [Peptostreptococcaceae bacterium]